MQTDKPTQLPFSCQAARCPNLITAWWEGGETHRSISRRNRRQRELQTAASATYLLPGGRALRALPRLSEKRGVRRHRAHVSQPHLPSLGCLCPQSVHGMARAAGEQCMCYHNVQGGWWWLSSKKENNNNKESREENIVLRGGRCQSAPGGRRTCLLDPALRSTDGGCRRHYIGEAEWDRISGWNVILMCSKLVIIDRYRAVNTMERGDNASFLPAPITHTTGRLKPHY